MSEESPPKGEGLEYAWKVHAALDSWTGKVDSKASITLALESAILGFVLSLSKDGERFDDLHGAPFYWMRAGLVCLSLAVFCSLMVVMPQLRRLQSRRIWRSNTVYFGHLRHWDPVDLAVHLRSAQIREKELARQLVTMSQIAWKKHSRLQISLMLLLLAAACLAIAVLSS
jgi:hypothetical protein